MRALELMLYFLVKICTALIMTCLPLRAETFIVPMVTNYPPYSNYNPILGWHGYGVDLAKRLIQTPDDRHQLDYLIDASWASVLDQLERGTLDFLWEVSYTDERSTFMDFIGVTDVQRMELVTRADLEIPKIDSLDDFFKLRAVFGRDEGFIYAKETYFISKAFHDRRAKDPEFDALFFSSDQLPDVFNGRGLNGTLLALGYIDASISAENDHDFDALNSKSFALKFKDAIPLKATTMNAIPASHSYIVIPKLMNEAHRQLIHNNYEEARQDGSLQRIWNRWFTHKQIPKEMTPG